MNNFKDFILEIVNMFNWTETGSPRLLVTGHSNSVISYDDISIDQFVFFFLSLLSM